MLEARNGRCDAEGPTKLTPDEKKKADDQQKILVQKNNAAVDELQAAVGHFNDQLKSLTRRSKQEIVTIERGGVHSAASLLMQAGTLITPRLAEEAIHSRLTCLPIESLPLTQCVGGTLRENIYAERDQPPFDRVTMDGIGGGQRSVGAGAGAASASRRCRRPARRR